jgi:uncharacterized protein YecE (DUF72 family)
VRVNHSPILLGTSSFTASGWNGSFYPRGMKPSDYLGFYAERFHTVEVDSTFYACPTARTVENWNARTPDGFVFSVKVPQTITHDKALLDCDAEIAEFLEAMDILGPKLGPIIFQFPFLAKSVLRDRHEFTDRLVPFLKKLPAEHKFGVEIRNRDWLNAEFADLLRDHQIALVLQDRSWMPNPLELQFDPITAGWTYIRWLGDRKQIEAQTMTWDKAVVDRTAELSRLEPLVPNFRICVHIYFLATFGRLPPPVLLDSSCLRASPRHSPISPFHRDDFCLPLPSPSPSS